MELVKTILLVEDNKHDQFFFLSALREIPNATLYYVANNGADALKRLEIASYVPDIIFTDIYMPMVDGLEFITELKKNPLLKNIPVVVFSSATWQMEAAQKLGVTVFLEKPLDDAKWREKLEAIINSDFVSDNYIAHQAFLRGQSSI